MFVHKYNFTPNQTDMSTDKTNGWHNTTAIQQLQQQLNDEDTAKGITHVLQRMSTLEKAIEKLSSLMEQGPGMVSMMTDMVDDGVRQAANRGINVDEHLQAGVQMLERLTQPAMVQKLNNLMDFADQAPGLLSMTVDVLDDGIKQAHQKGINIDERLNTALDIAEKLTAPQMLEKLDKVLQLADQAPGLLSMTVDILDDGIKQTHQKGINIDERLNTALDIAEKLTAPQMLEKLDKVLQLADQAPGLLSMTVDILDDEYRKAGLIGIDFYALSEMTAKTSQALSKSRQLSPPKIGLWGLMRALNDSDRQKAMGFLMEFLKQLGHQL